jgi:peroxiredoxin
MIQPGEPAPDFTLPDHSGTKVSLSDFAGRKLVLCFYPNDFSPVCTDQLSIYQEVVGELEARNTKLAGVSVDSSWAHRAFRKQLNLTIALLSDFHPKGEMCRAYGAFIEERGHSNRSLVLVGEGGDVEWSYAAPTPLEIPGANLIFDALEGAG